MSSHLMPVHHPLPIVVDRAEGVYVWDQSGRKYLDSFGGLAVCLLGHTHPAVTATLSQQIQRCIHTSNALSHPYQEALAAQLCIRTGLSRAFFNNSGAEAIETALKLARIYGHDRGHAAPAILVFDEGFHGRTLATLSASGFPKGQVGYEPLVGPFPRVPFNDMAAVRAACAADPAIVAILIEPIQGAAGIRIAAPGFLQALRTFCDETGRLLITDEIQCGMGRTGYFLNAQSVGVQPDITVLAKGLANGIPIGACLATEALGMTLTAQRHGSTFGGNPLATAAACTVLSVLESESLIPAAGEKGRYLLQQLHTAFGHHPDLVEIRGQGLMVGLEFSRACTHLPLKALSHGLLLNIANQHTVRLLPALTITHAQIDEMVDCLKNTLS